jgi:hypothetical protein
VLAESYKAYSSDCSYRRTIISLYATQGQFVVGFNIVKQGDRVTTQRVSSKNYYAAAWENFKKVRNIENFVTTNEIA